MELSPVWGTYPHGLWGAGGNLHKVGAGGLFLVGNRNRVGIALYVGTEVGRQARMALLGMWARSTCG